MSGSAAFDNSRTFDKWGILDYKDSPIKPTRTFYFIAGINWLFLSWSNNPPVAFLFSL